MKKKVNFVFAIFAFSLFEISFSHLEIREEHVRMERNSNERVTAGQLEAQRRQAPDGPQGASWSMGDPLGLLLMWKVRILFLLLSAEAPAFLICLAYT